MLTLTAVEARDNIGTLWEKAASEPVMIESAGQPLAVIMSPSEYERLTSAPRKPRVAGTGANLLANIDVEALLATPIDDVFAEYM